MFPYLLGVALAATTSCSGSGTSGPLPVSQQNQGSTIASSPLEPSPATNGFAPATAAASAAPLLTSAVAKRSQALISKVASSTTTTLFHDDFEAQNYSQWSRVDGYWSTCRPAARTFALCDAEVHDNAMYAGVAAWTDYTLQSDVVLSKIGSAREGMGVAVRAKDANHYYEVDLVKETDGSQQWEMWRNNGGTWLNLARGSATFAVGAVNILRVQVAGSVITASMSQDDGSTFAVLGTGSDGLFPAGKIGVRSWSGMTGSFDNISVTTTSGGPSPTSSATATATPPSATPTPSAAPTAPSSNVATYDGCRIFTAGDYYNADITSAPVDAHSADYIASIVATDNTGFYASTGIEQLNVASASTPLYTVRQKVAYHSFPVQYPWANGYYIEPAGDAHGIVLLATPPSCHLFESYSTSFGGNVLSAYSGANWDLSKPFAVLANASPSAMASGLSLFAGMVKFEEIATGVHHAVNFSMFSGAPCNCYTAPASDSDNLTYTGPATNYKFPYGGHLRLKASFDDSRFGPQAKAISQALKHYGGFLADTGGHYGNNNAIYTANPTSGGSWNGSDLGALSQIHFTDFEVLPIGSITNR